MTLEELNKLKGEAVDCQRKADRARTISKEMAGIRNGDKPLMVAYKAIGNWDETKRSLIEGVINECGADLLRIIEMRQDAHARLKSEQARQKLAAIAAALGEQS